MSRNQKLLVEWTDKLVALVCLVYQIIALHKFSGYVRYDNGEPTILLALIILLGILFIKSIGLGIYFKERSLILVSSFPFFTLLLTAMSLHLITNVAETFPFK